MAPQLLLLATTLLSFIVTGVRAETCRVSNNYGTFNTQYKYCEYGCCSYYADGCCIYSDSTINRYYSSTLTIALAVGCSIGGLILIGVIIAIICCCVRRRGSHGQIVTTLPAQPMVTTATTTHATAVGGVSGPYPMQPVGNPWYPQPQQYGGPQPQQYGGAPPQQYGGPPPHVQPGYSQPPGLPTYSPPLTSSGPAQPQADGYQAYPPGKEGDLQPLGQPPYQPGYTQPTGPPAYGH